MMNIFRRLFNKILNYRKYKQPKHEIIYAPPSIISKITGKTINNPHKKSLNTILNRRSFAVTVESPDSITRDILNQIKTSQSSSVSKRPMLPLCVPFEEKDQVKKIGAVWCPLTKTWFWNPEKCSEEIEKWLPKIYRKDNKHPILPRLVPEPLWGLNLRAFLSKNEWDVLRKKTYKQSGYRCEVCGCKGTNHPVECDEEWSYELDYSPTHAMVHFKGLRSLCPECHQVCHFGKSRVDGKEDIAFARLMLLNEFSYGETHEVIDKAFEDWKIASEFDNWLLNTDILEQEYNIYLDETNGLSRVRHC